MVTVRMIVAWCELRDDFRNFRTDRVSRLSVSKDRYPGRRNVLLAEWRVKEEAHHAALCERVSEV